MTNLDQLKNNNNVNVTNAPGRIRYARGALASVFAAAVVCGLTACAPEQEETSQATEQTPTNQAAVEQTATSEVEYARVDSARLEAADTDPGQWMSYGRTYSEQRFSPLDQINTSNVNQLGLAWFADLDTNLRQETTPLMIDGVIYISTAWSKVKAYDAVTGAPLWEYDPEVPGEWNVNVCCGLVSRGIAAWNGKIYIGALDGRLIALDAKTGAEVWSVMTIDPTKPYSITGAPRVAKGRVLIGQAGAEFGVRGYISAYDAETGELDWRFYTVPGNPADGFENAAMEMAAQTWNGEWWTLGGGGTVWDSIVYDPVTDLVYVGVGNGSPWNASLRSPGGGDNLFLSSIVALDADDGSYVWHYQTTPGETWDYTATQPIMVADLVIRGVPRHVVMQAPKNGFFYVMDAATGEFISADAFTTMTWAEGVDPESGRPIERPEARYDITGEPFNGKPGPGGAHSWHPMAFNPETGLVYFSVADSYFVYAPVENFTPVPIGFNTGINMGAAASYYEANPDAPRENTGYLIAWDPVARREAWRAQPPRRNAGGFGQVGSGVLATAGGLVFQGTPADRVLIAYDATNGTQLWSTEIQAGTAAGAISYAVNGEQYVALVAGTDQSDYYAPNHSRLLVFKLGGSATLPEPEPYTQRPIAPPPATASAEVVAHGQEIYVQFCSVCHGDETQVRATFPDLRRTPALHDQTLFNSIVLGGVLSQNGMASFDEVLDEPDTEGLRAYLISVAQAALAAQGQPAQ